jgi:amino acid transporter, AAT family
VSTASDVIAAQLLLKFWTDNFPGWAISLIILVVVVGLNMAPVRVYGEVEYWLSLLKVITIVIFIIIGVVVNCGGNRDHKYIGDHNWYIGDAPFVGGIGGFASVFVTASFAYGGTESIAVTAGETKNPSKMLPKVVRNVFWRILLFYILSVLLIGLNVPYNYPNLNDKNTRTSPFTIVFTEVGSVSPSTSREVLPQSASTLTEAYTARRREFHQRRHFHQCYLRRKPRSVRRF